MDTTVQTMAGSWTHLQDDFHCEDRCETDVKVSKNLGTETPVLDETWVTWESLSVFRHPGVPLWTGEAI